MWDFAYYPRCVQRKWMEQRAQHVSTFIGKWLSLVVAFYRGHTLCSKAAILQGDE